MGTRAIPVAGREAERAGVAGSALQAVIDALHAIRSGMRARDEYVTLVGRGKDQVAAAAEAMRQLDYHR